jgi:superfamily II DNA helicase RecQ
MPEFSKHIHTFIVDEAHCILQWGDKFREEYSKLGTLHAFVPAQVPFLITSATLTQDDLSRIRKLLHIEPSQTYVLNLGNDCPNITWNVRHMQAGSLMWSRFDFSYLTTLGLNHLDSSQPSYISTTSTCQWKPGGGLVVSSLYTCVTKWQFTMCDEGRYPKTL